MTEIPVVRSELFTQIPSLRFGMSTRVGGVSPPPFGMNTSFSVGDDEENVRQNREKFFFLLNITQEELAIPRQVHSCTVKSAEVPGSYEACDALVTNKPRVFLCVSVADCVPVFVVDEKKKVVAGIHAGWRGTVGRIAERTLTMMRDRFDCNPRDMRAFVGPCASVCCYNVGNDVASQFDREFIHTRDEKSFVDLKSANVAQLVAHGMDSTSIEVSSLCTIGESKLLHSFRRDKEKSGRMFGTIGFVG